MKYKILLDTETQLFTVVDAQQNSGTGVTIQAAIKDLEAKANYAA
ncbi:hypothetical protein [Agrilactobacillus composti]|nr:hypothetical protein [Agrilactobacillus composti]